MFLVATGLACTSKEPPPVPEMPDSEELALASGDTNVAANHEGWTGVVVPRYQVDVASKVDGKLIAIHFGVGDRVPEGALVAELDNKDLQHQARVARKGKNAAGSQARKAKWNKKKAQAAAKEMEQVAKQGAIATSKARDARFEAEATRAELSAAQGSASEAYAQADRFVDLVKELSVYAPFEGRVTVLYQSLGQLLPEKRPILRLISEELLLRFAVPQHDAAKLKVGDEVQFVPEGAEDVVTATIKRIAPEVGLSKRVMVEASFVADANRPLAGVAGQVRAFSVA